VTVLVGGIHHPLTDLEIVDTCKGITQR